MNKTSQVFALILIGLGMALLGLYQRQYNATASGGEPIKVLAFAAPVERDKVVTEEMLSTRLIPQAYVEDRAVKDLERAKVTGLHLSHDVKAGETVMWSDLVTASEKRADLSSLVPVGSRAVAVRASGDSSAALILPGDYVDIIGVMSDGGRLPVMTGASTLTPDGHSVAAVVLVQRVLVLAAGTATSPDDVPDEPSSTNRGALLTLSLTIPEAQLVALAADRGRISVALRNREDARTAANIPDLSSQSLLNNKEREDIKGRRAGSAGPTRVP